MNATPLHRPLTPAQYAALQDAARSRATRLRNEAIADAWSALGRQIRRGVAGLGAVLRRPAPQAVARTGAPAR